MFSSDKRFEIICHTRDDDSYMYSDTDYEWFLASVETGDSLAEFSGHWNQGASGESQGGIQHMQFSEDGKFALALDKDDNAERVELPAKIEIIESGARIRLTYEDGRTETRKRKAVVITTKFGRPIGRPLVDDPGAKS